MPETPAVGSITTYEAGSGLVGNTSGSVSLGEELVMLVTGSDDETGVYSGYAFLPGGGGYSFVTVDPERPEAAPAASDAPLTMADVRSALQQDPEYVAFLESRRANAAPAAEAAAPAENTQNVDVPTSPAPSTDTPLFSGGNQDAAHASSTDSESENTQ